MKNRFIVIYTFFAAAVFIFSMGFFGYSLFSEYNTNIEKSELEYTELVNNIRTISFSQEENNSSYSNAIKNAVGDTADYSFIQVRRNNETVVLYPTGKSREETVSRLTKSFSTSLNVNKQAITVDCNLYLIRPDSIFYYSRISFLMILIITIITIIMIIYLNLTDNTSDVISLEEGDELSDDSSDNDYSEVEVDSSDNTEADQTLNSESNSEVDSEIQAESEQENTIEEPQEEERHTEITPEEVKAILSEPLTDAQTESAAAEASDSTGVAAKLPLDEITPAPLNTEESSASNEPTGLFDPDTGIGWESYLVTRLNNEIDRATASEIDLSLFIFKLPEIAKTSETFKNVCNYLSIQFQFKDLLFEYKDDCIIAIKISMNVDEALTLADKLYTDICNIVNSKSPRIGISSRSIRIVTADRLLLEAEQSIEHSDDKSPVIAFRVDSEKYRQLMEGNQA